MSLKTKEDSVCVCVCVWAVKRSAQAFLNRPGLVLTDQALAVASGWTRGQLAYPHRSMTFPLKLLLWLRFTCHRVIKSGRVGGGADIQPIRLLLNKTQLWVLKLR